MASRFTRTMSERTRPTLLVLLVLTVSTLVVPTVAPAASYEILFEEGAYKYEPGSGSNSVNNKYLARVTIKRDESILAKDIRGSTFPDAAAFYVLWNVQLRHEEAPNDADVLGIYQRLQQRMDSMRSSKLLSDDIKRAVEGIVAALDDLPVLKSRDYPFVMGVHKGGTGPHGHPYVPRLLGGTFAAPYDPDISVEPSILGGFIRSLTKNNAQGQRYLASGINVHDGRVTRVYKDSEGCLTIRPQDWRAFYSALPSPEKWKKGLNVGVVRIKRAATATAQQ